MDAEGFKKMVTYYGGPANIVAILFDNSAVKVFVEGEFKNIEDVLVDDIGSLQFVEHDAKGNPFHVVKELENVQGVVIKDSSMNIRDYDRYSIRG